MVFLIIQMPYSVLNVEQKLEDIGVLESTEIQDNDDNNAKDTSVIIIKGGRVVDPVSKTDEIMDIIIKNNNN